MTELQTFKQTSGQLAPSYDHTAGLIKSQICFGTTDTPTGTKLDVRRALHDKERAKLEARYSEVRDSLQPGSKVKIAQVVSQILSMFPSSKVGQDDARMVITGYVSALQDLPDWAVEQAAQKWVRGEAGGSLTFAPSAPELRLAAQQIIKPFSDELETIDDLLHAQPKQEKITTLEDRERVKIAHEAFKRDMEAKHQHQEAAE